MDREAQSRDTARGEMASLSRSVILAAICGLLFLAPRASWSVHRLTGQKGPGEFQKEGFGWRLPTRAGPTGHPLGDRFRPAGDKILLAKAPTTSKKKG